MVSDSQVCVCGCFLCLSLRKLQEIEDPFFFEPPSRGLPGIEKGALIEIVKGVFGLPDSPRGWWKELRDTLEGDSWTSLKLDPAFFCLRDFSGHLIEMIIVHVDDMLLATKNSHQAASHISRFHFKYEIKAAKRATTMEVSCSVESDMKPGGLSLRLDQTEFVKARYEPASMPRARARQEGAQCTTQRNSRDAKYDREFALCNGRNTSGRVIRDQSVAEETISAPGVRSQARRPNF